MRCMRRRHAAARQTLINSILIPLRMAHLPCGAMKSHLYHTCIEYDADRFVNMTGERRKFYFIALCAFSVQLLSVSGGALIITL